MAAQPLASRTSVLGPLNLPKRVPRERRVPEHVWGYVLLAPAVVLVLGLILYPVAYSFYLSLHSKHAYMPIETFVGFQNFEWIWEDEDFWISIKLGCIYAFGSLGLQIVVGVAAALTGVRTGAFAAGDLEAVRKMVGGEQGAAFRIQIREKLRDLMVFAVSDDIRALRQAVGTRVEVTPGGSAAARRG